MSDEKNDLSHLVCQMQALVRGTLIRRAFVQLRKEYEELACSLDGFDSQQPRVPHQSTQTAVQWPLALLCNPHFTSPIKGPESDILERLAKRQWRKPAASQLQHSPATLPQSPQPSATEATTSPYNSASFDSCSSEGSLGNASSSGAISVQPSQPSSLEGRETQKDEANDRASCDSKKEISHAENPEGRVVEQPAGQVTDGPDVRNLNETDLTLVSSIESSSVHLSSSEDGDGDDDEDDDADDTLDQGLEKMEEQSSRRPSKTNDAIRNENSNNDDFTGHLDYDVNGSTDGNSSNSVRDNGNSQQRTDSDSPSLHHDNVNSRKEVDSHPSNPAHSLRDGSMSSSNHHGNYSLVQGSSKQERTSSPNPSADAEMPVAVPSPTVTSDIVTMETQTVPRFPVTASDRRSRRDDTVPMEASSTPNNCHSISPSETGGTDSVSVISHESSNRPEANGNLPESGHSDSLMQLHDTSVAADMTSVWSLDQSEMENVAEDDSSKPGADAEKLREMRNSTAMELLWIQQAIESRKNYLRLKSKIGRGEPGSANSI